MCYPIVPGHEFAGEVVAVGRNVLQGNGTRDLKIPVGTRVAVEPNLYCGHCEFCRTGRENLCLNYAAIGVTVDGAVAEYVTVPATNDEITVLGSMAILYSFEPALNLLSSGAIDTEVMLTAALPLEDFPEAISMVRRGEGVKTQILPNG